MSRPVLIAILALLVALPCAAQADRTPQPAETAQKVAVERSGEPHELLKSAAAKTADAEGEPTADAAAEVYQDIIIEAGKNVPLTSTIDFASAGSVAVTVRCSMCATSATSLSNAGLVLQALWTISTADYWVATENKSATTFAYWDNGGAVFSVYGPMFRLNLQNKGAQTISLQQVTIFRRAK